MGDTISIIPGITEETIITISPPSAPPTTITVQETPAVVSVVTVGVPGPQGPQGIQGVQGEPGPAAYMYNYILKSENESGYIYYGFSLDTNWRIKRKDIAAGSWMVATGAGDFNTAWLDRANKGYGI